MTDQTQVPQDLTLEEAADELRIHRNTLSTYLKAGQIPGAYQVGPRWRIPREALDAYKRGCPRCAPTGGAGA